MHFGPDGDLHASLECSQTHCLSTYSPRTDMSYGERWAWLTFAYPFRVRAKRHALLGTAQHRSTRNRSTPLGSSRLLSRVRGPGASRTLHLSSLRTRSRQKGDFDSSPSACSALVARTWAPRATLAANRHQEASVARASRSMQGATPFY